MCTSGALSARSLDREPVVLLAKTLDSAPTTIWHGWLAGPGGRRGLGMGMVPQVGVNSGVNDAGLAILMSYLDYRPASEVPRTREAPIVRSDRRGALNAAVLARCTGVDEALEVLYELAPKDPNGPGGNHILADPSGRIAVFEHCAGKAEHRYYDAGHTARGNNGLLIFVDEQRELPTEVVRDRETRCAAFLEAVRMAREGLEGGGRREDAIAMLKVALASHGPAGPDAVGSICAHGVAAPGARSRLPLPYWTLTAVILDATSRAMTYCIGNACTGRWQTLFLS